MLETIINRVVMESFTNFTLITALVAMACVQVLKVIYYRIVEGKFKWVHMFEAGGMPSSHSALVCSLTTLVGLKQGFNSDLLAIAGIFSAIVMYDAIKVRAEEVGHTIVEVTIGGVLGIIIALISYIIFS